MKVLLALACLLFASLWTFASADDKENEKQLEIYKNLLMLKRKEHLATVESVAKVDDFAKQFKTISIALDAIFPVLEDSMKKLEDDGFTPTSPFPTDQGLQDVLGKVYENVLFFGDFLLRIPDMTKKVFLKNKDWNPILEKAMKFCEDSKKVFVGRHGFQLTLMFQEIGFKPKEPDYVNPYRKKMERNMRDEQLTKEEIGNQRATLSRGPRLRGSEKHNEL